MNIYIYICMVPVVPRYAYVEKNREKDNIGLKRGRRKQSYLYKLKSPFQRSKRFRRFRDILLFRAVFLLLLRV